MPASAGADWRARAPAPGRLRWPTVVGCVLLLLLSQAGLLYWAGRPPAGVGLQAVGPLTLAPGEAKEVAVRVERRGYQGPVELIPDAADGLTVGAATIPEGAGEGRVRVTASAGAAPGPRRVTLRATAGGQATEAAVEVTVAAPQKR